MLIFEECKGEEVLDIKHRFLCTLEITFLLNYTVLIDFYFMCMGVFVCMHVYVPLSCLWRPEKGTRSSVTGVIDARN